MKESVLAQRNGHLGTDSRPVLAGQDTSGLDASARELPGEGELPAVSVADAPGRAVRPRLASLPYAIALAAMVGGLAWMWLASGHVKAGAATVGCALIVAAVARLVLPERRAGLLVSRHRLTDVMFMAGFGVSILVLALVLPSQT